MQMPIKILKTLFLVLTASMLVVSCTFDDTPTEVIPGNTSTPHNPSPSSGASDQQLVLTLSWDATDVDSFDVYFESSNPPELYASNHQSKSITIGGLDYNKTYYWRIESKPSGLQSGIWNFTTKSRSTSSDGYVLVDHSFQTESPSIIKLLFQVLDLDGNGVDDLNINNLQVLEDGEPISPAESNLQITKRTENNYVLRTVLMLDNSTSLGSNIADIRSAALEFVSNKAPNQEIAIYEFSEDANMLVDFTSNISELNNAILNFNEGFPTTNLYGAVVEGAEQWDDEIGLDNIVQGSMIVFTDGEDTQGSHTLNEALNAIEGKQVYTVGLGTELDTDVLNLIGTSGFYSIGEIDELSQTFLTIEEEIKMFANSFYWLQYTSPKRGNSDHTLRVGVIGNPNQSYITGEFNSAGFFSVAPGIYINSSQFNPEGIDTLSVFTGARTRLEAVGYFIDVESFVWATTDASIADIEFTDDPSVVYLLAQSAGSATVTAMDQGNTSNKAVLQVEVRTQ